MFLPIRLITHNIRLAADDLEFGEAPWCQRKPLLTSHLRYQTAFIPTSIICLQEVLHHQLTDILTSLNARSMTAHSPILPLKFSLPGGKTSDGHKSFDLSDRPSGWVHIGVGREDGHEQGEYNPILLQAQTWEVLEQETRWLSPKPKEKGWDASSKRVVTVARLRHRETHRTIVIMNTHLDNDGVTARREAARMLRGIAVEWGREDLFILAGDLNSQVNGDAYRFLNQHVGDDARDCIDAQDRYGEEVTYTGFAGREQDQDRIDYIFVGPKRDQIGTTVWQVRGYSVLANKFDKDNLYHSDHRAVVADVEVEI